MICKHEEGYDLVCLKIPAEDLSGTWGCMCKGCRTLLPFNSLKGLEDIDAETVWEEFVDGN